MRTRVLHQEWFPPTGGGGYHHRPVSPCGSLLSTAATPPRPGSSRCVSSNCFIAFPVCGSRSLGTIFTLEHCTHGIPWYGFCDWPFVFTMEAENEALSGGLAGFRGLETLTVPQEGGGERGR